MNESLKKKTAVQKLRDAFWEKKSSRKISPELKEILEKHKEEKDQKNENHDRSKVARSYDPEAGV